MKENGIFRYIQILHPGLLRAILLLVLLTGCSEFFKVDLKDQNGKATTDTQGNTCLDGAAPNAKGDCICALESEKYDADVGCDPICDIGWGEIWDSSTRECRCDTENGFFDDGTGNCSDDGGDGGGDDDGGDDGGLCGGAFCDNDETCSNQNTCELICPKAGEKYDTESEECVCADGYQDEDENGTCEPKIEESCSSSDSHEPIPCNIDNGTGEQKLKCQNSSWVNDGACKVTSCDDGYHKNDAQLRCVAFVSCLDIKTRKPKSESGSYKMDINGDDTVESLNCDMTTTADGVVGGWTEITAQIAYDLLGGNSAGSTQTLGLLYDDKAKSAGFELTPGDLYGRPFTQDDQGDHSYHYTFRIPFEYSSFYLKDYKIKGNEKGTINGSLFQQTTWSKAYLKNGEVVMEGNGDFYYISWGDIGDVSFGAPGINWQGLDFILTSFGRQFADIPIDCKAGCTKTFPKRNNKYQIFTYRDSIGSPIKQRRFRIGWGEAGAGAEGWFPWYAGTINVR